MSKELLINYFNKNNKFFNETNFRQILKYAEEREPKTEEFLKWVYSNYANKKEVLLLPYAVIKMLYFEAFPKLGEKYFKHLQVKRYLNKK